MSSNRIRQNFSRNRRNSIRNIKTSPVNNNSNSDSSQVKDSRISPCSKISEWNWKEGSNYRQNGVKRTMFDCGEYFFDGKFNLVRFQKGINVYHGSIRLTEFASEYPVGVDFYEPVNYKNKKGQVSAQKASNSNKNLRELLSEELDVEVSWYGDINVAVNYSNFPVWHGNDPYKYKCKNCTFAYRTKKEIVMILINDDENILNFFNMAKKQGNKDVMNAILDMNGFPKNIDLNRRKTQINLQNRPGWRFYLKGKNRKSTRKADTTFANWLCQNIIKPEGYDGSAAPEQHSTNHPPYKAMHLEFIFCNAVETLERDTTSEYDWQYVDMSNYDEKKRNIIEQMKKYIILSTNLHSGNLYENTSWKVLFAEYLTDVADKNNYLKDLLLDTNINKFISIATFLSNIGKMTLKDTEVNRKRGEVLFYRVPEYKKISREYFMGDGYIPYIDSNGNKIGELQIQDFEELLDYNPGYNCLFALIIDNYGDFISNVYSKITEKEIKRKYLSKKSKKNISDYIDNFYQDFVYSCDPDYYKYFSTVIVTSIIVATSHVLSYQPFKKNILELVGQKKEMDRATQKPALVKLFKAVNHKSEHISFITDQPKLYRGTDYPEKSEIFDKFEIVMKFVPDILSEFEKENESL